MHGTARQFVFVIGLGLLTASQAFAQTAIAHFSHVEGDVTRLHRFASAVARQGGVLAAGDRVQTSIGRAEMRFADGSVMELDRHTLIEITAGAAFRLLDGRVSLRTTAASSAATGNAVVRMLPQGLFEITATAASGDLLIRVVEGHARVQSPWGIESVTATQTAFVSGPTGMPFVSTSLLVSDDFSQVVDATATPPPFLPYAHPSYRQSAYERVLRKGRHVGHRNERRSEPPARRSDEASRPPRHDRRRNESPAPAPVAQPKPARAAGAGVVVRTPQ